MTHAGPQLTEEQLRQQLGRRVGVAPLTPDDRTNLIRAARLRLSEPVRPSLGPRTLGWLAGITAVVVLALISIPLLIGSFATPNPTPTPAPTGMIGPNGVTLDQAVSIAQSHVPDGAELWSYAPGWSNEVMQDILGPGSFDRPPLGASEETLVWGIAFSAGDGLTTVYLNLLTGEWLENRNTPAPLPARHRGDIVFDAPLVNISNGTTLVVHVWINGREVATAPPDTVIDARSAGEPPWSVVARTASGRQLLALEFRANSAWHTTGDDPTSATGPARRVDLSCGRLDIWVGTPMIGPMPPTSGFAAHDCDP